MIVYQKNSQRLSPELEQMFQKETLQVLNWKQRSMSEVCPLIR